MGKVRPVFVCNSPEDSELANSYVSALRERGVDVWHDENLTDDWVLSDETRDQIKSRPAFMVMMSADTEESLRVGKEIMVCLEYLVSDDQRVFLPVRIGDCRVPRFMQGFRRVDAFELSMDAAVDQIIDVLTMPPSLSGRAVLGYLFGVLEDEKGQPS
jgi:hypothetical protein